MVAHKALVEGVPVLIPASPSIFFCVEPAGSSYKTVPVSMHLWVERAKKEHIS